MTSRVIAHVVFHLPDVPDGSPDLYRDLLLLLEGITPLVQAIPPHEAVLDLSGSQRYWGTDPRGTAHLIQMRTLALHGVTASVATAPSVALAAIVAATLEAGESTHLEDDPLTIRAFLRPQSLTALPGVGPATARTLHAHGLRTIADIADLPPATLARLLGAAASRQLRERAQGYDPRPVQPHRPARSLTATTAFPRDELHPAEHRRALVGLAENLGTRLREQDQVLTALELSVRYADRSQSTRSRQLRAPTNHSSAITAQSMTVYALMGLQRARVLSLTLRGQGLAPAATTPRQLSLDPAEERSLRVQAAADRARRRFGTHAVQPAVLATRTPHPVPDVSRRDNSVGTDLVQQSSPHLSTTSAISGSSAISNPDGLLPPV